MTTQTTSQAPSQTAAPQTSPSETVTKSQEKNSPIKAHRRDLRRYIWLPVLLCVALIAGVVLISLALGRSGTSGIADIMLSFLCILPLLICLFPLYLVLIVSIVLLSRFKTPVYKGMESIHEKTSDLNKKSNNLFNNLSRRAIDFSAKLAALDVIFGAFERFEPHDDQTGKN